MSEFIDVDALGQLKEFIAEKFPEVVDIFIRTSEGYVRDIVSGFGDKDVQRVIDAAHPLKSSSGNLGLVRLGSLCGDVEDLGIKIIKGEASFDELGPFIGQMQDVYSRSLELLRAELD